MKGAISISQIGRIPAIAAPTAAPTKPASEMGVSRTRSGPKRSSNPRVEPKALSATSSPRIKVLGSRSISSLSAARIACKKVSCAIDVAPTNRETRTSLLLDPQILAGFGRLGHRALAGELDCGLDLVASLPGDTLEFLALDQSGAEHLLLQRDNRASRLPSRDFLLGAVAAGDKGLLADHMSLPSVGFAFK